MKEFIKKISDIQATLKAPKNQYNKFGQYNYRSCEDILEAVKPLLNKAGLVLTISDDVVQIGGRVYVKSTSTITDGTNNISNTSWAREAEEQKGMSPAQITGSCSSYAKKYSLNGLFLIDDTKDADATNTHGKDNTVDKVAIANKSLSNSIAFTADTNTSSGTLSVITKPAASFKRPVTKQVESVSSSDGDL
jgi:ERF superfamily